MAIREGLDAFRERKTPQILDRLIVKGLPDRVSLCLASMPQVTAGQGELETYLDAWSLA